MQIWYGIMVCSRITPQVLDCLRQSKIFHVFFPLKKRCPFLSMFRSSNSLGPFNVAVLKPFEWPWGNGKKYEKWWVVRYDDRFIPYERWDVGCPIATKKCGLIYKCHWPLTIKKWGAWSLATFYGGRPMVSCGFPYFKLSQFYLRHCYQW